MNKESLRIVYMGTPEISAIVLAGILDAGFHVVGVVTNPDKPVGRKGILTPSPVKELALSQGIPVYQPVKIRLDHDWLAELKPDVILTMAYGQIVPQAVLDCPKYGCLNLHGSLLPALRGAAPIQRALDLGLTQTGVTLMEMVAKMDAGKMYSKATVDIEPGDNYTSLAQKIAIAAKDLAISDLLRVVSGELPGEEQDESQVTFANKITPEEEKLDFASPMESLLRHIRALSLTPGAYAFLEGKKLKILRAEPTALPLGKIGEVVSVHKGFFVSCADGVINLTEVQLEGKKPCDGKSFVNGYRDLLGKVLS